MFEAEARSRSPSTGDAGLLDVDPGDVVSDASDGTKLHQARNLLDRLRQYWGHVGANLADAYRLHAANIGTGKLKNRLAHEVGYRARLHGRVSHADEPRGVLGSDEGAIRDHIAAMSNVVDELVVVPSSGDRRLVGSPAYPGGSPPNPYCWIPVIAQNTKLRDIIWEMGPCWSSSARWVADQLGRQVVTVQLPAPGDTGLRLRNDAGNPRRKIPSGPEFTEFAPVPVEKLTPKLVLVPLPLPLDAWSILDCLRMFMIAQERIWNMPADKDMAKTHPEFALDFQGYVESAVSRLRSLETFVRDGTLVCLSTPMVRGLDTAMYKAIRRELGWSRIDSRVVIEEHGKKHRWNGSPIVRDALTVWRSAR